MKGKMILYGIGGAGINIVSDIKNDLMNLGEGFSDISVRTIDTTDKTVKKYDDLADTFYKVESNKVSTNGLDGMAGERKNLDAVKSIQTSMKKYLDEVVGENKKNEYHILISSASGGSGSLINSILLSMLRQHDYNVLPVIVGDESTLLNITNTINTIVGFNNIARKTNSALGVFYISNSINGVTTPKYEKEVNLDIKRYLSVVSMFVSGDVQDIDQQDMNNFFIPSRYKSFDVEPGIYRLGTKVSKMDDGNAIIVRTAIIKGKDFTIDLPLLHNKVGTVMDTHIDVFGNKSFPVFLTLKKNEFNTVVETLQEDYKKLEAIKNTKSSTLEKLSDSVDDEEFGLVL